MPTRLLVVNDTQEILDTFRVLLEEEGYEAVLSSYPFQKISEVELIKANLIILDFLFGAQTFGWQMVQLFKMQRSTRTLPILVCTAVEQSVCEQEGSLVSQGVRVMYKPFDIALLLTLIKDVLDAGQHPLSRIGKMVGNRCLA